MGFVLLVEEWYDHGKGTAEDGGDFFGYGEDEENDNTV